jgi:hypothetical protein
MKNVVIEAHGARPETCYVTTYQGPRAVFDAYTRGKYPRLEGLEGELEAAIRARGIRWGAYGDPGALPLQLVRRWSLKGARRTGYTHQWSRRPGLRAYLMASVETLEDAALAQSKGWRTFRVALELERQAGEIVCPATTRGLDCQTCGLCHGASSRPRWQPTDHKGEHQGIVIWEGPSRLDGAPIVAIATGLARSSSNEKTGPMVQTWILRQDQAPHVAQRTGADESVCGNCPLRPLMQRRVELEVGA